MSSKWEKKATDISTNYRWLWFALGVLCALVMLTGFGALAQAGLLGVGLVVWSTVHLVPLVGFAMGLVSTTWYAVITAVSGLTALAMLREFWQPGYLLGRLSKLWNARKVQRNLKRSFKMTFGDRVEDQSRMLFDGWMRKIWPGFDCGKKPKSVTLPIFACMAMLVSVSGFVFLPFLKGKNQSYHPDVLIVLSLFVLSILCLGFNLELALWGIAVSLVICFFGCPPAVRGENKFGALNYFGAAVGLLFLSLLELVFNPFQALLSGLDIVENLVNQCWEFFAKARQRPTEIKVKIDSGALIFAYQEQPVGPEEKNKDRYSDLLEKINLSLKASGNNSFPLQVVSQDSGKHYLHITPVKEPRQLIALGNKESFWVKIRPAEKSAYLTRVCKFLTGLLIDTLRFILECLDDVYKFIPRWIYQYWEDVSFPQPSEKDVDASDQLGTVSALDLGRVGPCAFPCWVDAGNGGGLIKVDLIKFGLIDEDKYLSNSLA